MAGTTEIQNDCFLEYANKEVVDIISKLSVTQFSQINEKFYNEPQGEENPDRKCQFKMIRQVCLELKANNYVIKTTYSRRGSDKKVGRRYADKRSLQYFWAVYRNALVSSECIDIDMKNAHPSIILKICKDNKIKCPNLKKYVTEKDSCIDDFIDDDKLDDYFDDPRTFIKIDMFISSINSEKEKITFFHSNHRNAKKKITNKFFLKFDKEMKCIQKAFINLFPEEYKLMKKEKSGNVGGRLMSYIATKYEDILLQMVLNEIKRPAVLMYDGFLIHKEQVPDVNALISQCNRITDGWVKWSEKTIDDDIIPYLKKLDVSKEVFSIIESTTLDIAVELLKTVYDGKIVNCKNEIYFKGKAGWVSNMKQLKRDLMDEITEKSKIDCHILKKDGDIVYLGDSIDWCHQVVEWLISKVPKNDNLINEIWDQTLYKLHFNNGVYNFKDDSFIKPDYNTFIIINRDFNREKNDVIRKQIYDLIIDPIFSIRDTNETENSDPELREKRELYTLERKQLRDFALKKLARVMCGHIEDKQWLAFQGARNCGKGAISDLMKLTFEDYVGSSNAENFLLNNRNEEEAKANSFMHDFQFIRLAICNEVSLKQHGATVFDGNKIKKAHSGGDFIEMRQLYKEKTNCRFQATVLFNLNDMPQCKPSDCLEKCLLFELNSKFIKPGEKKPFSNIDYFEANDWIKTDFIKQADVQNEWFLILLDAYKTDCKYPARILEEQIDDRDVDDMEAVFKMFDIGGGSACILTFTEIKDLLANKKVVFTFAKVKKMLLGKGCVAGKSGDDRLLKNVSLKNTSVS